MGEQVLLPVSFLASTMLARLIQLRVERGDPEDFLRRLKEAPLPESFKIIAEFAWKSGLVGKNHLGGAKKNDR